jgi:hypothetical protein
MFPAYLQISPYLQIYRSVSPDLQICIVTNWVRRGVGWSLRVLGSQIKLSKVEAVPFSGRYGENLFHARRRATPLHSACQGFGNVGVCFCPVPLVS